MLLSIPSSQKLVSFLIVTNCLIAVTFHFACERDDAEVCDPRIPVSSFHFIITTAEFLALPRHHPDVIDISEIEVYSAIHDRSIVKLTSAPSIVPQLTLVMNCALSPSIVQRKTLIGSRFLRQLLLTL